MSASLLIAIASGSALAHPALLADRTEDARLEAPDPSFNARFGHSVAADGETMLVGSQADAAYVFVRSSGAWALQARLVAADPAAGDGFGLAVALSGNVAVVAAPFKDGRGAVYVFARAGTIWAQEGKLEPSDLPSSNDFGHSVDVDGDTVVVGAHLDGDATFLSAGAVYVYTRSAGIWSEQAKLVASDRSNVDLFGYGVATQGDTLLAGAPRYNAVSGPETGSVYVFQRAGSSWTELSKFRASDPADGDWFGLHVDLSENLALVGSYHDDDDGADSGSAYVFQEQAGVWTQEAKLRAVESVSGDNFGVSVALSCGNAVVGANYHDAGATTTGAAYLFQRSGPVWVESARLLGSDRATVDEAGYRVAVGPDFAVVGSARYDGSETNSGVTWVFGATGAGCSSCLASAIAPLANLLLVRSAPADVALSWLPEASAEKFDVWYVTAKADVPFANLSGAPIPAQAVAACQLIANPVCTHAGGLAVSAGPLLFYNVIGACGDGTEAPL